MPKKIKKDTLFLLVLLLIAVIIYFPALNGKLFYDDEYRIIRNVYMQDIAYMPKFFTTHVYKGAGFESFFYRPLPLVAHSLIYQFFKTNPLPYHIFSLMVHFGSTVFLFYFLKGLGLQKHIYYFSSLLFLVHPVQTQSVSYISGLEGALGLFFLVLALLIYRSDEFFKNKRILQYILFALSFIFSLLSKERAAIFLALLFVTDISFPDKNKSKKTRYAFYIISAAITAAYFLLRSFIIKVSMFAPQEANIYTQNIIIRFYTFLYAFWEYLVAIFFPLKLYSEHPFLIFTSIMDIRQVISLAVILFFAIFSVYNFRKHRIVFFAFFWFMLTLAPSSGVLPMIYTMKEHWTHYGLIGLSAALTYYFFRLIKNKKIAAALLILICVLLSIRTFSRNIEWGDAKLFWENELKNNPESENAIANLAYEYYLKDDIDKAIELYKYGIKVTRSKQLAMMYYNLGFMYHLKGNVEEAIPLYKQALEIDPYYLYALDQLSIYYKNRDTEQFNLYNSRLQEIQQGITG